MNTIWTLAKKDLRLLIRDKAGAFFTFGFPIMYALFFGMVFKNMGGGGGPTIMEIIVVDQDQTEASKAFVQKLNESDSTRIVEKDLDEAAELVQKGKKPAYVLIQEGYGKAVQNIFWGDPPAFEIGVDPSKRVQAMMLEGLLMQHAADNFSRAFSDKDTMSQQIARSRESVMQSKDLNAAERVIFSTFFTALDSFMQNIPGGDETDGGTGGGFGGMTPAVITTKEITQQKTDTGNTFNITFPQSLVWGLMGCAATFGISLVVERVRGTLVRLRMSPISFAQILAGKGLACFIGLITVNGIMLVFGMVVFDLSPNNYPLLILAILCSSICFVGIMMLLSVLGKTEASASGIGWAVLIVMAMLGGGMVPYMFLPDWIKTIASISPVKWTVVAMEGAIFRGFSLGDMMLPCGVLVGIGVVCFALGARVFRWMES